MNTIPPTIPPVYGKKGGNLYTPMSPELVDKIVKLNNLTQCLTCLHFNGLSSGHGKVRCHAKNRQGLIGRLAGECVRRETI